MAFKNGLLYGVENTVTLKMYAAGTGNIPTLCSAYSIWGDGIGQVRCGDGYIVLRCVSVMGSLDIT